MIMKKFSQFYASAVLIIALLLLHPQIVHAADYTIQDYQIQMNVNEDNTYDITETIQANFDRESHGIIREIPVINRETRSNSSSSKRRAYVSDIVINKPYTKSYSDDNMILKIGDAQNYVSGDQTYSISYRYNNGRDPLSGVDEFYFNLLGDEWNTTIDHFSFSITFPREFDGSYLQMYTGKHGNASDDGLTYQIDGTTLSGEINRTFGPYEAVTVQLILPEDYFTHEGFWSAVPTKVQFLLIGLGLIMTLITYIVWRRLGWNQKKSYIQNQEKIAVPPNDLSSLDICRCLQGTVSPSQVSLLILELANEGFLTISEPYKGHVNLLKQKDYSGSDPEKTELMSALFQSSSVIDVSRPGGKFFKSVKHICDSNTKGIHKLMHDEPVRTRCEWIYLTAGILTFIGMMDLMETSIIILITMVSIACLSGLLAVWYLISRHYFEFVIFAGVACFIAYIPASARIFVDPAFACTAAAGAAVLIFCIWCAVKNIRLKSQVPENDLAIQILGFKQCLTEADDEFLTKLMRYHPDYVVRMVPYAKLFGISEEWTEHIQRLNLSAPTWFNGPDPVHANTAFYVFLSRTFDRTVAPSMNGSSGSSSSDIGGGFSGGGSGGGGGSSW